jgi:hypothetical protein
MYVIFNELSLQQPFYSESAFHAAIEYISTMRRIAKKYGHDVHCTRTIAQLRITESQMLQQAVQSLSVDARRGFMSWVTATGPFWDDQRTHSPDEYMTAVPSGELVTDTGIGEAAFRTLYAEKSDVLSYGHGDWSYHPIGVDHVSAYGQNRVDVTNYYHNDAYARALEQSLAPVGSWEELRRRADLFFPRLRFLPNAYDTLVTFPFGHATASRLHELFMLLELFAEAHEGGARTPDAQQIYQTAFTGSRAWFTDSSDAEKSAYKKELTFQLEDGRTSLCGMHGKVNSPSVPIRFHFSWPISSDGTFTVVHVGRKITM